MRSLITGVKATMFPTGHVEVDNERAQLCHLLAYVVLQVSPVRLARCPLSARLGRGLSSGAVWTFRGCFLKTGAVITSRGVVSTRLAGRTREGSVGITSGLPSHSGAP